VGIIVNFPFGTDNTKIDVVSGSLSSDKLQYGDTLTISLTVQAESGDFNPTGTRLDVSAYNTTKSKQTNFLSPNESQTLSFTFDLSKHINSRDDYGTEYIYVDGTQFAKIYVARKGDFTLTSSHIPQTTVKEGNNFDVSFTFSNTYLFTDVRAYGYLYVGNITYNWDMGTVPAGETKTLTKTVTAPDADKATIKVNRRFGDTYTLGTVDIEQVPEPTPPPDYSFSNLRVTQDGEKLHPKVDVTNTGGQFGEVRVDFTFNGEMKTNDTLNLSAGETKTATGTYIPTELTSAKVCAVEHGGDAEVCGTFTWGDIIKPLEATNTSFPSEVKVGESFSVSCDVVNDGAISKDGTVVVTVDGDVRDRKTVSTVPPNDSEHVSFTISIGSRGSHEICCDVVKTSYSI